jgi:hypothetical protein
MKERGIKTAVSYFFRARKVGLMEIGDGVEAVCEEDLIKFT